MKHCESCGCSLSEREHAAYDGLCVDCEEKERQDWYAMWRADDEKMDRMDIEEGVRC